MRNRHSATKPGPNPQIATKQKKSLLADEIGNSIWGCLSDDSKSRLGRCPCCVMTSRSTFTEPTECPESVESVLKDTSHPSDSSDSSIRPPSTIFSTDFTSVTSSRTSYESVPSQDPALPHIAQEQLHTLACPGKRLAPLGTIQRLAAHYGEVSQMGILDPSYQVFVNRSQTAGLCYKVQNKVAVVGGNPMGEPDDFPKLMIEFEAYRKKRGLGIAFLGADGPMVDFAKRMRSWSIVEFGKVRVLNPVTNEVLQERCGKRIVSQSKYLLNPNKGGIILDLYDPAQGIDAELQNDLIAIYKSWCTERKSSRQPQAFTTAYEPFSMPELMLYIYSRGPDNRANGFAALRWIGAKNGYHIDPCVAVPGSPRGISDLLLFSAMALLRRAGVSHLSFGCEPFEQIGEISGMMKPMKRLTRLCYQFTFQRLPLSGKRAYHEKFRPDDVQESALFLLFPSSVPDPRQVIALVHTANISVRKLIFGEATSFSKRLYMSQSRVRTMNLFSKRPPNPEHSS